MYPKHGIGKRIHDVLPVVTELYEEAERICKKDCFNLVLHKHLGDVLYAIASKNAFEATHKTKLRYLIRPKHAFIAKMYGISEFGILDMDKYVLGSKVVKEALLDLTDPSPHELDCVENSLFQSVFSSQPLKGKPFVCENNVHAFFDGQRTDGLISFQLYWAYRWAANMGIDETFHFPLPNNIPSLSAAATKALSKIGNIKRIVVLAPEANTAAELEVDFWNILSAILHKEGYKVVVNSKRFRVDHAISVYDLGLSLPDVIAMCYASAYVFAIRSGLCDVVASLGSRLYVFYPSMLNREVNGLNYAFDHTSPVNEIEILNWKIGPVRWENKDLSADLQKDIDRLRTAHSKLFNKGWLLKRDNHDLAYRRSYYEELALRTGYIVDNNAQKRLFNSSKKLKQ